MPRKQLFSFGSHRDNVQILDGFDSFAELQRWYRNRTLTIESNAGRIRAATGEETVRKHLRRDWYGRNADYETITKGITQFSSPDKLEAVERSITDKIDPKVLSSIKKRKLRFSESFGNFSFDRAAQGLFILDEFYSPKHKRVIEDWNDVEEYEPEKYRLIEDKSRVERRKELREDGTKKYRTSMKKVFGYFPEVSKEERSVELIVNILGNCNLSGDQLMYVGTAAIIIAKALILGGVKVAITASTLMTLRANVYNGVFFTVKNYNEPLDVNAVAVVLSDSGFIRYEGFNTLMHNTDEFNEEIPFGLGNAVSRKEMQDICTKSGYIQSRKNPKAVAIFMGAVYSESAAVEQAQDTIVTLAEHFNSP